MRGLLIIAFATTFLYASDINHFCKACSNQGTVTKDIETSVEKNCNVCNGGPGYSTCGTCGGQGIIHKKKRRFLRRTKRWTETCPSCGGAGRFYCSGSCTKGKKIYKVMEKKQFPCEDANCLGSPIERMLCLKTHQKLETIRQKLNQINATLKRADIGKRQTKSINEVIMLQAKNALVAKKWGVFVNDFGKTALINQLGQRLFLLYEGLNMQMDDLSLEIIEEAEKTFLNN